MERFAKWKEIFIIAAPVVVSKLSFTAMGVVDTAMVGHLGPAEQAGVGIATTLMVTFYVFGLGIVGVVATFVAQYYGANRRRECGIVLGHGLKISAVLGALTWLALYLSEPFFSLVGLSEDVSALGYDYLMYRCLGLPGVFFYWTYNSYLEGLGKTRGAMHVSLAANLVNIALDYALIFGAGPFPAMGVNGAGLATAGSNFFMLVCFVVMVHRPSGEYKRKYGANEILRSIDPTLVRRLLKTGWPVGLQFFLECGALLVFSIIVGWVSDEALAASQVALRILSVSFMTAWGISAAATALVGRYQGRGESELARDAGRRSLLLTVCCTVLFAMALIVKPNALAGLFTQSAEVIRLATSLVYIVAVCQVFEGIRIVSYGALKGAGDTRWPMFMMICLDWGLGTPLIYLFTIGVGLGVLGTWLGLLVLMFVQSTLMLRRFGGGKWESVRIM